MLAAILERQLAFRRPDGITIVCLPLPSDRVTGTDPASATTLSQHGITLRITPNHDRKTINTHNDHDEKMYKQPETTTTTPIDSKYYDKKDETKSKSYDHNNNNKNDYDDYDDEVDDLDERDKRKVDDHDHHHSKHVPSSKPKSKDTEKDTSYSQKERFDRSAVEYNNDQEKNKNYKKKKDEEEEKEEDNYGSKSKHKNDGKLTSDTEGKKTSMSMTKLEDILGGDHEDNDEVEQYILIRRRKKKNPSKSSQYHHDNKEVMLPLASTTTDPTINHHDDHRKRRNVNEHKKMDNKLSNENERKNQKNSVFGIRISKRKADDVNEPTTTKTEPEKKKKGKRRRKKQDPNKYKEEMTTTTTTTTTTTSPPVKKKGTKRRRKNKNKKESENVEEMSKQLSPKSKRNSDDYDYERNNEKMLGKPQIFIIHVPIAKHKKFSTTLTTPKEVTLTTKKEEDNFNHFLKVFNFKPEDAILHGIEYDQSDNKNDDDHHHQQPKQYHHERNKKTEPEDQEYYGGVNEHHQKPNIKDIIHGMVKKPETIEDWYKTKDVEKTVNEIDDPQNYDKGSITVRFERDSNPPSTSTDDNHHNDHNDHNNNNNNDDVENEVIQLLRITHIPGEINLTSPIKTINDENDIIKVWPKKNGKFHHEFKKSFQFKQESGSGHETFKKFFDEKSDESDDHDINESNVNRLKRKRKHVETESKTKPKMSSSTVKPNTELKETFNDTNEKNNKGDQKQKTEPIVWRMIQKVQTIPWYQKQKNE
ncbi:hypothetical protein BLOT_011045 [Blomia tropicalis]|nr:hypothetical protein BLOT_011045 [Blomia tropicalis]